MEIPLTKAPLGKDTFWIGTTAGCGWHWLLAKAVKYKTPRNSRIGPTGRPIASLDIKRYDVREDRRTRICWYIEEQQGDSVVSGNTP